MFHPDRVWPWPQDGRSPDPETWILELGRYDHERWRAGWQELFDRCELVRNRRAIERIVVSREGDGALAIVDIDTLWRDADGRGDHWQGRTCKIYTLVAEEWKMITQLGTYDPASFSAALVCPARAAW